MSPSEWIACEHPAALLANLADQVTDRKRLLFAVVCCRRAWDRLDDPSKGAVAVAEAYADQRATYQRVMDARKRVLERLQIRRGLVAALELERTNTEERVALGYAAAYVAVDPMQSAELAARAVADQVWKGGFGGSIGITGVSRADGWADRCHLAIGVNKKIVDCMPRCCSTFRWRLGTI